MVKGEDDLLATQRLLEVIRGERDAGALFATSGQGQESAKGQRSDPPFPSEGVVLTRPSKSRHLLPGRVRVGLDLGKSSVKMIRLERGGRGFRVLQMGIGVVSPRDERPDAYVDAQAEVAKALLRDVHPKKELIVTSVSDPGIIIRQATLPRMSAKDFARSIRFEARKYMPYDPSQVILRYQVVVDHRRGPTCQVLLVAVPREAMERHRALLQTAGIRPYAVEVGPLALANAHLAVKRGSPETAVLLDLGESRTVIDVFREGGVFFCRQLPISSGSFRQEIMTRCGLSRETAERVKNGGYLPDGPDPKEVAQALRPLMDGLLVEVRRSLAYYDNITGGLGFSRVLITGGGSFIQGLRAYLEAGLRLPVGIMDPLEGLTWDDGLLPRGWVEGTRPLWAGAVGLATRR